MFTRPSKEQHVHRKKDVHKYRKKQSQEPDPGCVFLPGGSVCRDLCAAPILVLSEKE